VAFAAGAGTSAVMINWTRRKGLRSQYASALMLEAMLLLAFGALGAQRFSVSATVLLLCYLMGLQNAIITKVSAAEIRTTHMTGNVTDLGIELGKLFYCNRDATAPLVLANRDKLKIHASLIGLFVFGGFIGAHAFRIIGFSATIPLAALLFAAAVVPIYDDLAATSNTC
jgi:uncharacterized membrane protein YoaK (UPF0700 family)